MKFEITYCGRRIDKNSKTRYWGAMETKFPCKINYIRYVDYSFYGADVKKLTIREVDYSYQRIQKSEPLIDQKIYMFPVSSIPHQPQTYVRYQQVVSYLHRR